MDPISMIVAAGIAFVFGSAGIGIGLRRRRPPATSDAPICTCKHGLAFHDPKTNICHGTNNGRPTVYSDLASRPIAWEQIPCTCRQYIGPIPAEQILANYLLPESKDE
jgi:hypothetical protein